MIARGRVALVIAVGACRAEESAAVREMRERIEAFATEMCACTGRACVEGLQVARASWSTGMTTPRKVPPAVLTQMEASNERARACEHRIMATSASPSPDHPAIDAGVPADAGPPPIASPAEAQEVLRVARDWGGGERVARLDVAYVGADGVLDPEFGKVTARFGAAPVSGDDPTRRTGLPVKPPPEQTAPCRRTVWSATTGWSFEDVPCKPVAAVGPRCPLPEVWNKAIAMGAPADAIASITYDTTMTPIWLFVIRDAPRDVNVQLAVPDDCALAVEAPATR